jgi:CubicO group peptidase (beta-lactamase class C family)
MAIWQTWWNCSITERIADYQYGVFLSVNYGTTHMKNSKFIILFISIFTMCNVPLLTLGAEKDIAPRLDNTESLETFIGQTVRSELDNHHVPGATVSIVRDGRMIFARGYGFSDVESQRKVDAQKTLFRIGSVTKLFTWIAVMQLYEQGMIDLDTDVNNYLEEFKVPDTFPDPVTMRHLMTHTAGFEDGMFGVLFSKDAESVLDPVSALTRHRMTRVRPAGQLASYSNYGTLLAGHIVEKISGLSYSEYIENNIFDPLRMTRSTLDEPIPAALAMDLANGYSFDPDSNAQIAGEFEWTGSYRPAGSATTTSPDMANFMLALLQGGQFGEARILKQQTLGTMFMPAYKPAPRVNNVALGFYNSSVNGRRVLNHSGNIRFFTSLISLLPDERTGIFISVNNGSVGEDITNSVFEQFMDQYFPAAPLRDLAAPADFAERAGRYEGTYRRSRHSYTKVEKIFALANDIKISTTPENTLNINILGKPMQWVEMDTNLFRKTDGEELIAFTENAEGEIDGFASFDALLPYYRIPWYETGPFHLKLLFFNLLVFVSILIGNLVRRSKNRELPQRQQRTTKTVNWICGLNLLFLAGFAATLALSGIAGVLFGLPAVIYIVLAIPFISLILTSAGIALVLMAWRDGDGSWPWRIIHSVAILASAAYLWALNYWNLIGFDYY